MTELMDRVAIETGSRLHFGLLCTGAGQPGNFAGVGLMVERPGWSLRFAPSPDVVDRIELSEAAGGTEAAGEIRERIFAVLARTRQSRRSVRERGVTIQVRHGVPLHSGFGAGTQLALATATALQFLALRTRLPASEAARVCGRAQRSGVGTYGFEAGGFLIDCGELPEDEASGRVRHELVPEEWRFVTVRRTGMAGCSGAQESAVFARDLRMPPEQFSSLWRLVQNELIPAVRSAAFEQFATGLAEYGNRVGAFFSSEQGGVYSDPDMPDLARHLAAEGLPAPVQSSWGPAVCVPAESVDQADAIVRCVNSAPDGKHYAVVVSAPLNRGATLRTPAPEQSPHRSFG